MQRYFKVIVLIMLTLLLNTITGLAQDTSVLTLEMVQELARKNYPLIRQQDLIRQTENYSLSNLNRNYLPQFSINGQATYQSDVTSLPISIPNSIVEPQDKDQYKITADVNQIIYDGGVTRYQKKTQEIVAITSEEQLQVEFQKLSDRINQLYLGILLVSEQLHQSETVKADLNVGIKRVEAQVKEGTAFRSNLSALQVEQLKNDQRKDELSTTRKGLCEVLSLLINTNITEKTQLAVPYSNIEASPVIVRNELRIFQLQDSLLGVQKAMIGIKNRPRLSLFAQGGYGKPGLNFLSNEFDWFYLGGVKMSWNFGGLYTSGKEKNINERNRLSSEIQKDLFLLNTNAILIQQRAELEKLKKTLESDEQIIQLRNEIKEAASTQLSNGVITSSDYIREVNAADQAITTKIVHELQLVLTQLNYQNTLGK